MEESGATAPASKSPTVLIVGASRGLGQAMAAEFLKRGWNVVGTVRAGAARTALHDLADAFPGHLEIEILDINEPEQLAALRQRLSGRRFEMLFVNAGTTNDARERIGDVTTEVFVRVMVTNALSPMRVIEALEDQVTTDGLIGAMSSGQGSIGNVADARGEVYRGSKAALNMFMKNFAARQPEPKRALLLLAPGWIQTDLGGPQARYTIEESVPMLVDILLAKRERPGLEYLNRFGEVVPW
jgi:NAD(P)-dependent dehydrogenase (short-subunit alcohol dehydrogenase family)